MKINRPLNQLFANEARIQILRTLYKFPGEFTGRHISRLSNLPHATTRLNLNALEDSNILDVKHAGRSKLYSLNKENILYEVLASLFEAEESVILDLKAKLTDALLNDVKIRNALVHASLYGSVAKGDEQTDSDIDLFILLRRNIDENIIHKTLGPLEDEIIRFYGNHLHIIWSFADRDRKKLLSQSIWREIARYGQTLYGEDLEDILNQWQKVQKPSQRSQATRKTS